MCCVCMRVGACVCMHVLCVHVGVCASVYVSVGGKEGVISVGI